MTGYTSFSNLAFRQSINGEGSNDLSANAYPAEWADKISHFERVVAAMVEYLRREGRDAADCSRLPDGPKKEGLRDFHLFFDAFMHDEWFPLLKLCEAAAEDREAPEDLAFEEARKSRISTPVVVKTEGSAGIISRPVMEAAE